MREHSTSANNGLPRSHFHSELGEMIRKTSKESARVSVTCLKDKSNSLFLSLQLKIEDNYLKDLQELRAAIIDSTRQIFIQNNQEIFTVEVSFKLIDQNNTKCLVRVEFALDPNVNTCLNMS